MKLLAKCASILTRGLAIATGIEFVMFLFARLLFETPAITFSQFLLILAFSMPVSLSHELFFLRRLSFWLRLTIHYLALTTCFTLLFFAVGKIPHRAATVFVYIVVFTAAYAVVAGILFPILRATGYYTRHMQKVLPASSDAPYERRFS